MNRYCRSCQRRLPLRAFDLGGERISSVCRSCAGVETKPPYEEAVLEGDRYTRKGLQIAALESQRRPLIAELVKIDAELLELRARRTSQIVGLIADLEQRRRSLIVSLVKLDDEIGELRVGSKPTPRVIVDDHAGVDTTFGADPDDDCVTDEI